MERSVEKADASDIRRKSRSLDDMSVSIKKSATSSERSSAKDESSVAGAKSKGLKRKRNSSLEKGAPSVESKKRRGGKEVSLNNLAAGSGRAKHRLGASRLKVNGFVSDAEKQEKPSSSTGDVRHLSNVSDTLHKAGNAFDLPSSNVENQNTSVVDSHKSNGLEGGTIISKRPRGFLRRKKLEQSMKGREIVGTSSNTRTRPDQLAKELSPSQSQICKVKRKLTEVKEDDSTGTGDHSCTGKGCNVDNVKATRRKFQGRKRQGSDLLDNDASLHKPLRDFPDDDEDNLEQNAARMLSSRFDPSCTGFSRRRMTSPKPANESALQSSQRNFTSSIEVNSPNRVLRPRKHNGRGYVRKRRHFYEVCFNNMDPYWVVKQRIRVFWPLDKCWYFGLVKDYDPVTKMHHVKYDDRDEEWINLQNERFKLLLFPSEVANKFNHERSIEEAEKKCNERHKGPIHDRSIGGLRESEPIISWLTRSSHRERPSALGILKKQRKILSASKGFKPVGIPSTVSSLSPTSLERSAEGYNKQSRTASENIKLSLVYFRRRIRKDVECLVNIVEGNFSCASSAGPISMLASVADSSSELEELYFTITPHVIKNLIVRLCSPTWGRSQSMRVSGNLWLCSSIFFLHSYKLVRLLPLVRMEIGFVDKVQGLKLFLIEGCLSWAVSLLCQVLNKNYHHKNSHGPSAENMPLKAIKFSLTNLQNNGQKLDFVVDMHDSTWACLENKLKQHCVRLKDLFSGDCAYGNVESLSSRFNGRCVQILEETLPVEDGQKQIDKSNSFPVEESDQVSATTLENFGSSNMVATDSKLSAFAQLRVQTDALSVSSDGDWKKSSHECFSNGVNGSAQSAGCSDVGKNSSDETLVQFHKLQGLSSGSEKLCTTFLDDYSSPDKSEGGCISSSKTSIIPDRTCIRAEEQTISKGKDDQSTSNQLWEMNEQGINSPNANAYSRHNSVSPMLGPPLSLWSEDFIQSGFLSTTKKPRTQVSYSLLSRGRDVSFKNRIHQRKGSLYKKLRTDSTKKVTVGGLESHRGFEESQTCHANVLFTAGDRGWRECGAEIVLDSNDQKDWKIVVKVSGVTKCSYKAHQVLQPGIPNRYTHAMMWKGGKDWTLEFTDRNQWLLFKMMHEQCFNRNVRAASVKNIPIPGVRLIDDGDESIIEVPFVRNSSNYNQQVGTDVEIALNPSHVLYDMDSDDEKWFSKFRDSLDNNGGMMPEVTDDMFERVMDMFEKVSYVKQCNWLTDDELSEFMADFGSQDIIKAIHEFWHEKRLKKCLPLIRQFQPPLWEHYQQLLKEWELAMTKLHHTSNECQERATMPKKPPEKPLMFAFCLRPRGLEANKGSKQRSHKKLMYTGYHSSFSREQDALFSSGRRFNVSSVGDDKTLAATANYDSPHSSQWLQSSSNFSPRDLARTAILAVAGDGLDRTHYPKLFRNFSKKNGMHHTPLDSPVMPLSCSEKSKRNGVYPWNSDTWECPSSKQLQPDGLQRQHGDINEFRLRDASSAAQHASNMAKLKREKAQWLMHKADLALHKAVVAIMTADAIKASHKAFIGDE